MNTNEIEIENNEILIRGRGRPIGSKNSVSVKEHNDRMTLRKENLKISFQKYKAEHQEELKATYKTLYNNNKEKKLKRMKVLYTARSFINQLMKLDSSILV
jgi:hypothetical protein